MRAAAGACLLGLAAVLTGCAAAGPPLVTPPPRAGVSGPSTAPSGGAFVLVAAGAAERPVARVAPGARVVVPLRVANAGDRARRFRLGTRGAAAEWARAPPLVRAGPHASRPVGLTLDIPRGARPGAVPLEVWAEPAATAEGPGVGVVYRSAVRVAVVVRSAP